MSGPKETAYDEHIAPLMRQIIAACKKHKINMAATFALDPNEDGPDGQDDGSGPLFCTTVLPCDADDERGHRRIMECRRVMYPQPQMFGLLVTTGRAP